MKHSMLCPPVCSLPRASRTQHPASSISHLALTLVVMVPSVMVKCGVKDKHCLSHQGSAAGVDRVGEQQLLRAVRVVGRERLGLD